MKAGVVYPQIELGGDTGAVKAFAQAAEDLGYDQSSSMTMCWRRSCRQRTEADRPV